MDGRALTALALAGLVVGRAAVGSRGIVRVGRRSLDDAFFRVPTRFVREYSDDESYILERMSRTRLTHEQAAAEQLAAEFGEAGLGFVPHSLVARIKPDVKSLRSGVYSIDVDLLLPNRPLKDLNPEFDETYEPHAKELSLLRSLQERWPVPRMTSDEAGAVVQNHYNRPGVSLAGRFTIQGEPVLTWESP